MCTSFRQVVHGRLTGESQGKLVAAKWLLHVRQQFVLLTLTVLPQSHPDGRWSQTSGSLCVRWSLATKMYVSMISEIRMNDTQKEVMGIGRE